MLNFRKYVNTACRTLIISGLLLLPLTLLANSQSRRLDGVQAERTLPSLTSLTNIHARGPILGDTTSLDIFKKAATVIWESNADEGVRLHQIVKLIYRQYDKSELLNPWHQDWVAYVLSKTSIPKLKDLSSAIEPDDIARGNHAFCSQLAILLMEILRHLGVNYQAVRFKFDDGRIGHFLTLAYASDRIFLLDPHRNPTFDSTGKSTLRLLSANTTQYEFQRLYKPLGLNVRSVALSLDDWNAFPAPTSRAFRHVTKHLSGYLWLYLITIGIMGRYIVKNSKTRPPSHPL